MIKKLLIALTSVVLLVNPLQIAASAAEKDGDIPATEASAPLPQDAFTPEGAGTVLDNITEKNGKEFYTFTTPAGNAFYLVIDRLRPQDNVYFLGAVSESDLVALAEMDGVTIQTGLVPAEADTQKPDSKKPPAPKEDTGGGSDNNTIIFVGIAAVAAFGVAFFIKKRKFKNQAKNTAKDTEIEDVDPFEDEEEIPNAFEDDGFGDDDDGFGG